VAFLDRVMQEKHAEVAAKKQAHPLTDVELQTAPPVRDFRAAIDGGGRIIAELKARTPTVDSFLHSSSLDALAQTYERNGAAAISIVTDEKNFGTSLDTVTRVRERVALPILVKDFVFDPYQVTEARAAGADALLLIARLVDGARLGGLLELVCDLGMSALVETHNEAEVETAIGAGATIVGVNNRDLDTMETSLETTRRLAAHIPGNVILVAESGIHTRSDVDMLAASGASAFLIGGSLLRAEDPGALLRDLTGTTSARGAATRKGES